MPEIDGSRWFSEYDEALAAAKEARKPILLQFHRDKCAGCKKLYVTTYLDAEVAAELHEWFVPLRLDILQNREIRARYAAVWTPSFYVLDWTGKLQFHCDGYLDAEDFRIILRLAKAVVDTTRGRYEAVMALMEDGLSRFPDNPRAAAMLFRKGMAWYLSTWERDAFRDAMLDIIERYPASPEARMWPWLDEPEISAGAV
jgi:thioredoxin-related protein